MTLGSNTRSFLVVFFPIAILYVVFLSSTCRLHGSRHTLWPMTYVAGNKNSSLTTWVRGELTWSHGRGSYWATCGHLLVCLRTCQKVKHVLLIVPSPTKGRQGKRFKQHRGLAWVWANQLKTCVPYRRPGWIGVQWLNCPLTNFVCCRVWIPAKNCCSNCSFYAQCAPHVVLCKVLK